MADLRVLGLFSGIGGLERGVTAGLRDLGIDAQPVCLAEREVFSAACLEAAMRRGDLAACPIWCGDVRDFPAASFAGQVDLVIGGVPCQPVSVAGKRKGTGDDRWLWTAALDVAREVGARYCFFENPPGLLSANGGKAFLEVLEGLDALGFDAEWASVRASAVGAPHRRERIFILGHRSPVAHRQHARLGGLSARDDGPEQADAPQGNTDGCHTPVADAQDRDRRSGVGGAEAGAGEDGQQRRRPSSGGAPLDVAGGPRREGRDEREPTRGGAAGPGGDVADAVRRHELEVGARDELGGQQPGRRRAAESARSGAAGGCDVADPARGGGAGLQPGGSEGRGRGPSAGREAGLQGATGRLDDQLLDRPGSTGGRPRRWPAPFPPGPGERGAWRALLEVDPDLAPAVESDVRRVVDELPAGVDRPSDMDYRADRLRALGNAVVAEQARVAFVQLWRRAGL